MTLTLAPSDFTDSCDRPNINGTRMLIHVQGLEKVACAVTDLANVNFADVVVGRARVFDHELTHGIRLVTSISRMHHSLKWIRYGGDWCISLLDAVEKVATPPRLSAHQLGRKEKTVLCADAGRTWEHSITIGKAFFEGNIKLLVAVKKSAADGSAIDIIPQCLLAADLAKIVEDPYNLIGISRAKADYVFSKRAGTAAALYVSNSDAAATFHYHCQSSLAWRANQILAKQQGREL